MTDILQLPGWEVSKTYEDATERTIEAAFTEPTDACHRRFHTEGAKHGNQLST